MSSKLQRTPPPKPQSKTIMDTGTSENGVPPQAPERGCEPPVALSAAMSTGAALPLTSFRLSTPILQSSNSTPNLSDTAQCQDETNVTFRAHGKRKHEKDETSDLHVMINSVRGMFSSFSLDMETRLNAIQDSVRVIREQNSEITKSVEYMSDKHDELLKRIEILENEKRDDRSIICSLEDKLDLLERKSRASCIEIRNIPLTQTDKNKFESKRDLCDIVTTLSDALNNKINLSEIRDVYRTPERKDNMRPIVVEFCSVIRKENMLQAVKDFNKNKSNDTKLHTHHLHLHGPKKGIFISETLTHKTQKLFYLAREFAKDNNFNFCWTSRGMVYLRKAEGLPYCRIVSESDLDKLRNKK